jgi:hypothetical protein
MEEEVCFLENIPIAYGYRVIFGHSQHEQEMKPDVPLSCQYRILDDERIRPFKFLKWRLHVVNDWSRPHVIYMHIFIKQGAGVA